jgi:hypothetical protein
MTIRATLKAEIDRAAQAYAKERDAIQQRYPLRSWMDWLKVRSRYAQAQAALKSCERVHVRTLVSTRALEHRVNQQEWSR